MIGCVQMVLVLTKKNGRFGWCLQCYAGQQQQLQQHQQQPIQQFRKDDWMCSNGSCFNRKNGRYAWCVNCYNNR